MLTKSQLILVFSLITFCSSAAIAVPDKYVEGTHYTALERPVPTDDPEKIEVVGAFWYGCPHCYSFEPLLNNWVENAAEDIEFVRFPAIFGGQMKAHAKIFFTAQHMNVVDTIHDPVYEALIIERKKLQTEDEIGTLFASLGLEREGFTKAFNSFSVRTKLEQAHQRTQAYGLTGTPSMVVNGKYRVITGQSVPSKEELLKVIEFLIEKERAAH